ncbi:MULTISPECIES: MBOAT family O-acyltransferase [unclassified Butyrivibrio]|uniref:MBOAT family O-acyltransferase n=1 Tax=unclassified Butyrivibrio TaxID=2639466 RepID=UPI0003B38954|nr:MULTISPECIES: MBOAT family O-acyltransferase [unclassified Butyrivibrio]MDC7293647.1 MBOAT family protein [Butyrivibrio sp. DSM 10294]
MQFISFGFLIFLPIVVLINLIIPRKWRYVWLFITSAAFYLSIDVKGSIVLVLSILTTYFAGLLLDKEGDKKGRDKLIFVLCLIINIGMILVLKYLGFFERTVFGIIGKEAQDTIASRIIAPIGISFYVLKAISYLIDVKRGDLKAERNIVKYALYVSFFPQIISGPIERAGDLLPQFSYPLSVDYDRLRDGSMQMLWGYFLKLVVADRLGIFVNSVYSGSGTSGLVTLLATIFYTFEIYCDFGGYSHIAIGAARILGIDVMKNFDSPYLSMSIAEFWRRWHISLSSFFKDYIYIPLGGNRKGTVRKYINIIIVFAVSGLWHGANYTFILWGLLHAVYQIIGFVLKPVRDGAVKLFKVNRSSFSHVLYKVIVTFLLVNFAWVFFRADSVSQAVGILKTCMHPAPWALTSGELFAHGLNEANMLLALIGIGILVIVDIMNYKGVVIREKIMAQGIWFRYLVAIAAVLVILVCGIWGPGYDAASFIYQQF